MKGADVNEGKRVLNIDFIIALKPDGLWGPLALFFIILNFLNKIESEVICMREFDK
jgi:hypothetical protein